MAAISANVEMQGISSGLTGVTALDAVDFRVLPGEVPALGGETWASKSTLIKALRGVYQIDAGTSYVDGKQRTFRGTADAQEAGVSTVYQEVNLCANLSIGENVMLGHEVRSRLGINWRATHRKARSEERRVGDAARRGRRATRGRRHRG